MAASKTPPPNSDDLKLTTEEPSLLFAIRELIRSGGIDFDKWWENFSRPPDRNKKEELSAWTKPKFTDITPKDKGDIGRWIRYYPDAKDSMTYYDLSGTDRDLIGHINAISYEGGGNGGGIPGKNSKPPLAGFPLIELYFVSDTGACSLKRLRLPKFTDDEDIAKTGLAEKLSNADVSKLAKKIKTIFGDTEYKWEKGKSCLSYSGLIPRLQGLEGWALCKNQTAGIALFTAILKIVDLEPDKDSFHLSSSTSRTKYKTSATDKIVLNEKIKQTEKRPVVDTVFDRAVLLLPLKNKPIQLVKRKVIVFK